MAEEERRRWGRREKPWEESKEKNGCRTEAGEERGGRGAGREEGWRVVMMDALLSFRAP